MPSSNGKKSAAEKSRASLLLLIVLHTVGIGVQLLQARL
jgi:hypothetical protein